MGSPHLHFYHRESSSQAGLTAGLPLTRGVAWETSFTSSVSGENSNILVTMFGAHVC